LTIIASAFKVFGKTVIQESSKNKHFSSI